MKFHSRAQPSLSLLVAANLFNIKLRAVFPPCDTLKEIPSGRVHRKNQLVCLTVAKAFKCRLILAATSVWWQEFFHHNRPRHRHYCLTFFRKKNNSFLSLDSHVFFSLMVFIFLYPIFQSDDRVCIPDGILMNKAILFIDMDGLFMCTEAWDEFALTFLAFHFLYCKEYAMYTCSSLQYRHDIEK